MACGSLPRTLIQVLADSLYVDEDGKIFLNTSIIKVDCSVISPVASCGIMINDSAVAEGIALTDNCDNHAIRIGKSFGISYNVRIITDSDEQMDSDEVIVYELNNDISFTLQDATGSGRFLVIKNKGTGIITVGSPTGEIDDNTTQDINAGDSMQLVDYALNKHIII